MVLLTFHEALARLLINACKGKKKNALPVSLNAHSNRYRFSLFLDIIVIDSRQTPVIYNSPTKQESISKD